MCCDQESRGGSGQAVARSSRDVLSRLERQVPPAVADRLESGLEQPQVTPQPAASVVLLRDAPVGTPAPVAGGPAAELGDRADEAGVQVYLLHRHSRMPFAAGMAVFPGGRLDPVDGHPSPGNVSDPAVRRCGVRETAEETGVQLGIDELYPWAHWITPACEPRRYDTYFYLAVLPPGQQAADISGETHQAEWRSVAGILAAADRGELGLMPPTRATLLELYEFDSATAALTSCAERQVEPVLPRPVREQGHWMFTYGDRPEMTQGGQSR